MTIDFIAALRLIGDLCLSISGSVRRLRGTPKQQFKQDVITVLRILKAAEDNIANIRLDLHNFATETSEESKIAYIQKVGTDFSKLQGICREFMKWIDQHENLSDALKILENSTHETLGKIYLWDNYHYKMFHLSNKGRRQLGGDQVVALYDIQHTVGMAVWQLEAAYPPDIDRFPNSRDIKSMDKNLAKVILQIQKAQDQLREFAAKNLSVENFYE